MQALFEYLAGRDLNPRNAARRIARWTPRTLINFIEATDAIVSNEGTPLDSPFSFVANSQLSGGPWPCHAPDCRIRHADRVGRFAGLYADQVTLQNPIDLAALSTERFELARAGVLGSLYVLWYLKPLMDAGLITIAVTQPNIRFCQAHMPEVVKSGKLARITRELERTYLDQLTIAPTEPRGAFSVDGPQQLLEHGTVFQFYKKDSSQRSNRTRVTKGLRQHLVRSIVRPIVNDIVYQNVLGARFGQAYLTDRDADFLALRYASDAPLQGFSRALSDGLAHAVPTLEQLPFADLVRLRRDEGEVFQVYRDAVARVLREVTPKDGRRVRQAFEDTVLPELNKIDAVVRNAQRTLRRSLTIDLLSGVGAVTIGLFSGILTPAAGALLAGLGGTAFCRQGSARPGGATFRAERVSA